MLAMRIARSSGRSGSAGADGVRCMLYIFGPRGDVHRDEVLEAVIIC